jgi:chaperone modulatory protein CbpM
MMNDLKHYYFSFEELCDVAELSSHIIIEIVEHGIIEPDGADPENWIFSTQMVTVAKKAYRLHRDLNIDWQGIALTINLLDELEQLKLENKQLRRRLDRFITD